METDNTKLNFKDKLNKFDEKLGAVGGMGGLSSAVGGLSSSLSSLGNYSSGTNLINAGYDTVADSLSHLGPYGKAASLALKGVGLVNNIGHAIFGSTSGLTGADKFFDSSAGFLLGGPAAWINVLGKKKLGEMDTLSQDVLSTSGWAGSVKDYNDIKSKYSGKSLGLFSLGKYDEINDKINQLIYNGFKMDNIASTEQMNKAASTNPAIAMGVNSRLDGGYNVTVGNKNGGKLILRESLKFAKNLLNKSNKFLKKPKNLEDKEIESEKLKTLILKKLHKLGTSSFKYGGNINIIPEGSLHKNKHHLEEIDEKFKEVTSKGIPIIVEDENGDIVQLAEIEKEEIIFRLEVTKKLEELSKLDTDEAAIEAGKLLTKEILYNTKDETKKLI